MNSETSVKRIDLRGEFNIFTATAVRQQLLDALDQPGEGGAEIEVEIDLAGVNEIDSAGIQLMIAAKREAATRNRVLRFVGHSREVFDVLELCDVTGQLGDPVLIQHATSDEAR